MEKELQAGTAAEVNQVNMGMAVMKEAGAKWLTALYDKLRTETSIVMNGFKNVGIVAVKKAREGSPSDGNNSNPPPPEEDEDPFN